MFRLIIEGVPSQITFEEFPEHAELLPYLISYLEEQYSVKNCDAINFCKIILTRDCYSGCLVLVWKDEVCWVAGAFDKEEDVPYELVDTSEEKNEPKYIVGVEFQPLTMYLTHEAEAIRKLAKKVLERPEIAQ